MGPRQRTTPGRASVFPSASTSLRPFPSKHSGSDAAVISVYFFLKTCDEVKEIRGFAEHIGCLQHQQKEARVLFIVVLKEEEKLVQVTSVQELH